jgi:hypothetical protein
MFIESTPTEAQLERVAERKYRAFLMTNMDGSQELITIFDGTVYFRVYDADHNFKDYELAHSDLTVTIDDVDAFFYDDEFTTRLDHAPATLGKE